MQAIVQGKSLFDGDDPFRLFTPQEKAEAAVLQADALISALNGEGQANG
jgi:hypothetical protein